MTDLQIIKKCIYKEEKIEYLLEQLGCENIKQEQNGKLITAKLPSNIESSNSRSVQIKIGEGLTSYIRSKGIQGDIFNIVQYILDCEFIQAKYWICNILNYSIEFKEYKPKKDWNERLHNIQKKRKKELLLTQNIILPENTLLQYSQIPSYEWWQEGLKCKTQNEFEVGMDGSNGTDKIIFPIRDENNKLLSVKARFTHEFEDNYKDMKYFYLFPYNRQLNIYNINRAKKYIEDEVLVFEGEKSCMYTWQWGVKNTVSTQGQEISPLQIRKLIQLNCKIIFVFDKDVSPEFFSKYKNQLKTRLAYYILDNDNLFKEKDSPVDRGEEYFLKLTKNKNNMFKI
jgi:DNA primase